VTITPTNVIQSNEYYPFGLQTASSWTRDNTTNNFLYDAGNELNATSGFYDLPLRNYDAALGRFFQVDPLAYRNHNMTPYHYAGNDPIGSNDPTGLVRQFVTLQDIKAQNQHHSGLMEGDTALPDWYEDGGSNPTGGGSQMQQDAAAVKSGAMGLEAYVMMYGTNVYQAGAGSVTGDLTISIGNGGFWVSNNYATSGDRGLHSETINGVVYNNVLPSNTISFRFVASQGGGGDPSNPFIAAVNGVGAVTGLAADATMQEIESGAVYATKAGARGVKLLGAGAIIAAASIAAIQLGLKINDGTAKNSDYARAVGAGVILGTSAIPAAGPFISFGLGMADAAGAFEGFYNSFDNPAMVVLYLNSVH
jgi:RHS repeat-associated protein